MDVIYSLIPGMMFFGLVFLVVLIWAVKKGQYEDMEGNANRILLDDDEEMMGHTDGGKDGEPSEGARGKDKSVRSKTLPQDRRAD